MSSFRRTFIIATGIAASGVGAMAFAGVNAGMMDQLNNRGSSSQSSAPSYSPAPSSAPSYSAPAASAPSYSPPPVQRSAPAQSQPNFRNSQQNYRAPAGPNPRQQQSSAGPRPSAPSSAPAAPRESQSRPNFRNSERIYTAPVVSNPRPQASSGQQTPSGANQSTGSNERDGLIGRTLSRSLSTGNPGNGNGGGHHNGGNPGQPGGNHDDDHRPPRRPNVVYVLPPYYYDYYWGGNLYYNFNGGWYTPYGSSYISVGPPYGLYTSRLPSNYSSFYYDDTRYYLHEDTYYTYDRSRGGYVVTPSPYGDDEPGADQDIFVYPAQGQSETQLADDRYACHRWGVKESGYDPLDDDYDRDRRSNYMRAMTACLEGRGYTVK
jgi:hypothetical protein